jgi:hypothetical protein
MVSAGENGDMNAFPVSKKQVSKPPTNNPA